MHSVLCRLLTLEQSRIQRRSVDFFLRATQETKLGEVFGEDCRLLLSGAVERVGTCSRPQYSHPCSLPKVDRTSYHTIEDHCTGKCIFLAKVC